jgi:cobalt-zinc-cadmium efflux system protein
MEPAQPAGVTIMVVAAIGVVINSVTAMFFFAGRDSDLNIRGAFLHMAADAAVSLGVVVSGALIWLYALTWMDPVISLMIAAVILWSTWDLLRDSLNLAVDAVPRGVNPQAVREYLCGLPGVRELHDLHIWAMSTTDTALTAHLVMDPLPRDDDFLYEVSRGLGERFGIHHPTLQIEHPDRKAVCHQSAHCAD